MKKESEVFENCVVEFRALEVASVHGIQPQWVHSCCGECGRAHSGDVSLRLPASVKGSLERELLFLSIAAHATPSCYWECSSGLTCH